MRRLPAADAPCKESLHFVGVVSITGLISSTLLDMVLTIVVFRN